MSTPVLVAYATRYGSTQEVAEAIAVRLRECELEVDVRPMRDVSTLEGYRAVVLGGHSTGAGIRTPTVSCRSTV